MTDPKSNPTPARNNAPRGDDASPEVQEKRLEGKGMLPSGTIEPVAPTVPPGGSPALAKAPETIRRSMPLALSVAIGLLLASFMVWFFYNLTWFILLLYLAFVLATIVEAPVQYLKGRNWPRTLSTVLILFGGLLAIGLVAYFLILSFNYQMTSSWAQMQKVPERVNHWMNSFKSRFPGIGDRMSDFDFAEALAGAIPSKEQAMAHINATFERITYIVVAFFTVMYMVIDGPDHLKSGRRLLPRHTRLEATRLFEAMCKAHRGWFLASVGNVASSAFLTSVGLWITGIPGALVLGVIAGLGELIPNVGPVLFAVPSIIMTLIIKPDAILYVLLMFAFVQTIQSYTISPLMMKVGVELPVLVTIISVLVMGTLFGILGVLVAIPLTADLVVAWNYINTMLEKDTGDSDSSNPVPDLTRQGPGKDGEAQGSARGAQAHSQAIQGGSPEGKERGQNQGAQRAKLRRFFFHRHRQNPAESSGTSNPNKT